MNDRRITIEIQARCGHIRVESFNWRLLKAGVKRFGKGYVKKRVKFYQDNNCAACFDEKQFHRQGIKDHLRSLGGV